MQRSKLSVLAMATTAILSASAENIEVRRFDYAGPILIPQSALIGKPLSTKGGSALDAVVSPSIVSQKISIADEAPGCDAGEAMHILSFPLENRDYTQAEIVVDGLKEYRVYLDGKKVEGDKLKLTPKTHKVEIKYASQPGVKENVSVSVRSDKDGALTIPDDDKRMFTLSDVMFGSRISGASVSPSGRFIIESLSDTDDKGNTRSTSRIYDLKDGTTHAIEQGARWMPARDCYYVVREDYEHRRYIAIVDPLTGKEEIFADNIPEGNVEMGPTEEYLVYRLSREGSKEDPDAYRVLEPEDRQPGWRNRAYGAIFKDGVLVPLTTGQDNARLLDIADDGRTALVMSSRTRLTKRPTTVFSLISIDIPTLKADTLVADDGFLSDAIFSPDGKDVLVMGSPEAFGRVGCVLPESVVPSMIQQELFVIDRATKNVRPITRDFNPNPQEIAWNRSNGKIYLRAENRDMYTIYEIDPKKDFAIQEIILPENIVKGFGLSKHAPAMAVWGQSDSNPDRLYAYDLKSGNPKLLDDPSATRLADARLAECKDWDFTNSRGDTIYGRFYLPDNFDPSRKYPLIVNYYGGCSPTQRAFETGYPWHVYAELGYVVYVVQPSGATGFGQEFSSRHVSTAGQGVADDIIEGTLKFCDEHPYIDKDKIGCIGASYGGFMTMYLQTVTDIFAAAISHAGISDHTSYWGEGYWGYSYSETSMGNDYPWSSPDLYVKQSPLYNAHKVNTPLLFVHGDSDNNVPVGESIQMFTALKLLGKDTALVQIADQDHHILDPLKREKWQNTIFAWFAKHLKGDDAWWNDLYPELTYE